MANNINSGMSIFPFLASRDVVFVMNPCNFLHAITDPENWDVKIENLMQETSRSDKIERSKKSYLGIDMRGGLIVHRIGTS